MSEAPIIDDSEFPLVIVTFPKYPSREMFGPYFQQMKSVMRRGPIALVIDIRELSPKGLTSQLRQEFFRLVAERDRLPEVAGKVSECVVASSVIAQQLLATYLSQVQPEGFEIRVMTSLEEGRAWSLDKLADLRGRETG